jgi:hypothetical protein
MSRRSDDGGSNVLWNVGQYLPDYMAQHPRRQPSSIGSIYEVDNLRLELKGTGVPFIFCKHSITS